MASNSNVVVKKEADTVRATLEKMKPQFALALPQHLTPDRLLRVTMTAVQQTPRLLECDRTSLFSAVMTCAQLGLEPDGILGQGYLVPFRTRDGWKVQFIPGYKGLLTLARNSGEIATIQAHACRRADEFSYSYGLNEHLDHVPAGGSEEDDITHFYAYAKFKDGSHVFEVMSRAAVDRIRDQTEAYKAFKAGKIKSTPWDSHYEQMGRKTAIRRLANYLPMQVQRAAVLDAAVEAGKHASIDDYGDIVIDNDTGELIEDQAEDQPKKNGAASKLDDLAADGPSAATAEEPQEEKAAEPEPDAGDDFPGDKPAKAEAKPDLTIPEGLKRDANNKRVASKKGASDELFGADA